MGQNILLVGCGNMGFAMLSGWIAQDAGHSFHVVEPSDALRSRAGEAGASVYGSVEELGALVPDVIFLAVKPQVMGDVVPAYAQFSRAVFVSVAAGVTCASLTGWLGESAQIIRTMPNTPAAIGEGMIVSYANALVPEGAKNAVDGLLAASGETGWIEEEHLMDAVTAISGSGPAYVFHFVECMAEAAQKLGLSAELSQKLAIQTVAGAGLLTKGSDTPPAILREQVTSPGGTTAAALEVFMGRMGPLVEEATKAARDRGVVLGKG